MKNNKYTPLEGWKYICPLCGAEFWARAEWVYKIGYHGTTNVYYCSYPCWMTAKRAKEEEKLRKKEARKNGSNKKKCAGGGAEIPEDKRDPVFGERDGAAGAERDGGPV
jgi:hypothetical protein